MVAAYPQSYAQLGQPERGGGGGPIILNVHIISLPSVLSTQYDSCEYLQGHEGQLRIASIPVLSSSTHHREDNWVRVCADDIPLS
jgi:hypothetical protein